MELAEIIAIAFGLAFCLAVVIYIALNQREKVTQWLKYAVSEAEKQLGGGTGQLKLRLVYDWFCDKFPVIAAILPFKVFSAWVDTALETMKKWLGDNIKVANYVNK